MHGGATSTGSKWGMGGKTWRAPSEAERAREAQERLARETERRLKIQVGVVTTVHMPSNAKASADVTRPFDFTHVQEIQHAERNIRKERELAAKACVSAVAPARDSVFRTR